MKLVLYTVICVSFLACNNSPTSNNVALINVDTSQSTNKIASPTKNINYLADCKNYFIQAKKLDSTLLKETDLNVTLANKAIKAFTDFAYYCQADSLSPVYLIKSAQIAKAINNYPQAKVVLDKCIADYPNFKNRAAALFLLAQLYDDAGVMNSETEAQKIYLQIIAEYPKSDWAKSAKGALTFIGKSDAQIIEELKRKEK